jgi:DNA-binding GntR family transcriptional regulator
MVRLSKGDLYDRAELRAIVNEARSLHSTTQEVILEALRQAILRGILPPGTRLRQEALADVLDAGSRIPVREALRVLESEELVDSQPHRGFTVTGHDPHQIEEIYEMRTVLETHALRIAIPLLTDSDVEELGELSRAMVAEEDPDVALQLRERFYTRLYSVTGRPRLVGLITRLRQEVGGSLRQRSVEESTRHHQRLFEAIQRGDADTSVSELASHYRKVAGLIRRALSERSLEKELEFATKK